MNLIKLHKRKIIVSLLVILEIISLFLVYKIRPVEEVVLEDVKLKEEEPNNNGFALMLEQDDGTYQESTENTWPTNMKFNSEKSGCIDVNGNKIEDALEYDSTNNIMNVSVGETAYCYVYFDIKRYCNKNETLGECLLRKNSEIESLNDNIEGGLYRYQGTDAMNYICFGTTDKTTCTGSPSTYMYRIIGIASNGQMKIIKKTSLGLKAWHSDKTSNTSWPESDLFAYLNGNDYLLNTTYVPVGWESKIATTTWKYGDTTSNGSYNGATIYAKENGWTNTVSAKIGLMYIHDYYYAYGVGGNPGSYSNAKTAWIFQGSTEWTMSRYGYISSYGYYLAWSVDSSGFVNYHHVNNAFAVRPVFYLTSDVEIIGGTGTSDDPFILK